jgi:uncharacterized membrane protein
MPVDMPNPLHPAVVHFPIVFILVGSVLACAAAAWRRFALPAAICLVLGAAGAVAAVETGHKEKRDEIAVPEGEGKRVLKKHEKDGEATRNLALGAALLATLAAFAGRRWPVVGRAVAVLTAITALLAAARVAETGRTGGELVYQYGVGLRF